MRKICISKHYPLLLLPHSFGPGTSALNSDTYNPLFGKILDPPLMTLASPVFISPIVWNMCENIRCESVYFKELHNKQEC